MSELGVGAISWWRSDGGESRCWQTLFKFCRSTRLAAASPTHSILHYLGNGKFQRGPASLVSESRCMKIETGLVKNLLKEETEIEDSMSCRHVSKDTQPRNDTNLDPRNPPPSWLSCIALIIKLIPSPCDAPFLRSFVSALADL